MDNTVNPTEKGMLTMFLFDGMSAETGNAISGFFSQFGLPLILIAALIIMFVLSARSNKKRQKQYQSMLDGLKAGSRVRTIGGIYGTITNIRDESTVTPRQSSPCFHKAGNCKHRRFSR